MKLTNQQVNALASKIYNEIRGEIKKYNDDLQTEEKFIKWRKDNIKLEDKLLEVISACSAVIHNPQLKCISNYHFESIANYDLESVKDIMKRVFSNTLGLKNYPTETMLKNDIILSTIECDNLDDIVNNIKKKYI